MIFQMYRDAGQIEHLHALLEFTGNWCTVNNYVPLIIPHRDVARIS